MSNNYYWSMDNRKYTHDESAPVGCDDCEGCSSCCRYMGDTIVQDPYDLWNFCTHMKVSGGAQVTFELLVSDDGPWELSYQDGVTLPNIKMVEDGRCPFLNTEGRCMIHGIRSGLCRLFPLGRGYEADGKISYYVLGGELGCEKLKGPGSMCDIRRWLGIEDIDRYESFLSSWHIIREGFKELDDNLTYDDYRHMQNRLLELFYGKNYGADFYDDYFGRVKLWEKEISEISS